MHAAGFFKRKRKNKEEAGRPGGSFDCWFHRLLGVVTNQLLFDWKRRGEKRHCSAQPPLLGFL